MQRLFPHAAPDVQIEKVYQDLTFPEPPADRPYVLLNFVITLDGQSTVGAGGAAGIGSATDHRMMAKLRAVADGLLHGASTVRKDNFPPRVPDDLIPERIARGLTPQPLGSVVTRSGNIDPENKYFSMQPPVVFTTSVEVSRVAARLGQRAQVIGAGETDVDLAVALRMLRERFDIRVLLCEGGPVLTHALIAGGYLDEIFLTLAPKLGSDRNALRLVEGPAFAADALPELELLHVLKHESELFLRYRVEPGTPSQI
jgi:5-amino-6-(5-phosphoribosylamino)uracil reductase